MFWRKKKKIQFFYECLAIFDFLGKWLLKKYEKEKHTLSTCSLGRRYNYESFDNF